MTESDSMEEKTGRSKEKMKRLIRYHYRDINDILEEAEKKVKEIQQEAMESIPPWLDGEIEDELTYEHTPELLAEQIRLYSDDIAHDPALFSNTVYLLRLKDAHDINRHLLAFVLAEGLTEARFSMKAAALYWIGALMREIEILEDILSSGNLIDLFHRMRGSRYRHMGHAPQKELLKKAVEIADEKWSKGHDAYHNEMADYLLDRNRFPEFSSLARNRLVRELKGVARKYNRVRGDRGAKRNRDK